MTRSVDPVVHPYRPKAAGVMTLDELLQGKDAYDPAKVPDPHRPGTDAVPEIGGRSNGLDPTRYGDWEKDGRCIDF